MIPNSRSQEVARSAGAALAGSPAELASKSEVLLLAVKPQAMG